MGCVSMTIKAFSDGDLSEKNFRKAETFAELELQSITHTYQKIGWEVATGASGTIKATGKVLQAHHETTMNEASFTGITPDGLKWLKTTMISQKHISDLSLEGLNSDRQAVFAGGVAILIAAFKVLKIIRMNVSDSALREGLYMIYRDASTMKMYANELLITLSNNIISTFSRPMQSRTVSPCFSHR